MNSSLSMSFFLLFRVCFGVGDRCSFLSKGMYERLLLRLIEDIIQDLLHDLVEFVSSDVFRGFQSIYALKVAVTCIRMVSDDILCLGLMNAQGPGLSFEGVCISTGEPVQVALETVCLRMQQPEATLLLESFQDTLKHVCSKCRLVASSKLLKCGRCFQTRYCSRGCQSSHWQYHKLDCKTPLK